MATCHLCPAGDDQVGNDDLIAHLRVLHPGALDGDPVEVWPDGRPVIVDLAPTPDEFRQAD